MNLVIADATEEKEDGTIKKIGDIMIKGDCIACISLSN
jgi:small nuclear ribonucleoprotein (snRNP)-like protein